MKIPCFAKASDLLARGESFVPTTPTMLWRLDAGVLRIDLNESPGVRELLRLALPGDLLGIEHLDSPESRIIAQALTPCRLTAMRVGSSEHRTSLLFEAIRQLNRRTAEFVSLRSGSIAERVRRLLLLIESGNPAGSTGSQDICLPSLKDMAAVVDSSLESVSRVIASLRRLDLVQDRRPLSVGIHVDALRVSHLAAGMTASSRIACPARTSPRQAVGTIQTAGA